MGEWSGVPGGQKVLSLNLWKSMAELEFPQIMHLTEPKPARRRRRPEMRLLKWQIFCVFLGELFYTPLPPKYHPIR